MVVKQSVIPSSAITTWSGFLYQGQIGLLHSMRLLVDDWNLDVALQLDSLEDFAIVTKTGGTIKPTSMHQVKALKNTAYSTYKEALNKLNNKNEQCEALYFHTTKRISNVTIDTIETDYKYVKIYEYAPGVHHCQLGEIQTKLEEICKLLYIKHFPIETYKAENEYVKRSIHYLTQMIIEAVIEVHSDSQNNVESDDVLAFNKTIPFSKFRDLFSENLNDKGDNSEYFKFIALAEFQRYYESYIFEYSESFNEQEIKKLDNYMKSIMCMDQYSLERFIKGIIPHREFRFNTISDYKDNSLSKSDMEDVFFEILRYIRKGEIEKCHIKWLCNQGNCYSPTAIAERAKRLSKVCAKIIENSIDTDVTLLFEGNTLITEELSSCSLYKDALGHIDCGEIEEHHIMRVAKIRMIKATDARGLLNEE